MNVNLVTPGNNYIGKRKSYYPMMYKQLDLLYHDIEAGKFGIYVWGRIEYTDTFKDCHWTEFCYEFVFDPLIKEFRAYSNCNKADRKDPYNPFFGRAVR